MTTLVRDLRNLSGPELLSAVSDQTTREHVGTIPLLTAWQVSALADNGIEIRDHAWVTVPDFLSYARMLNTGQAAAMLRLPGSMGKAMWAGIHSAAGIALRPHLVLGMNFWIIAEALLRYDLALLPRHFAGMQLLHSYLTDFACEYDRRAFMDMYFRLSGSRPAGVHTQQVPLALSCLSRWGHTPAACAFVWSQADHDASAATDQFATSALCPGCTLVRDLTSYPFALQHELADGQPAIISCEKR